MGEMCLNVYTRHNPSGFKFSIKTLKNTRSTYAFELFPQISVASEKRNTKKVMSTLLLLYEIQNLDVRTDLKARQ